MSRVLFFLVYIFQFQGLSAQEIPPVQNYGIADFAAGSQNWSITQSKDKHLFFGNNIGLLEFDGSHWTLHPSPNGTIIRAVHTFDDLVYTGGYMDFGYWEQNDHGLLDYFSLTNELSIELKEDEHFWNITSRNEWILFQSLDRIYLYNSESQKVEVIELLMPRAKIFNLADNIYVQKGDGGLYSIQNGKVVLESDHPLFYNNFVVGLFEHEDGLLILSEKGSFYFLKNGIIEEWRIDNLELGPDSIIYCSIQLHDGSFILGTVSKGYIRLDSKGHILERIDQEKGLGNNTILSAYEDFDKNLWLGLDNGISVVNLNSAFKIYTDNKGKLGSVYSSLEDGDHFYLGTNQGLYTKRKSVAEDFKLIKGTAGQVWDLKNLYGTIFCGHTKGTFLIKGNTANQIYTQSGTWEVKKIPGRKDVLLQGNYNGLSTLVNSNGGWVYGGKVEGFDISSKSFDFAEKNKLVVNHEFKGLHVLEMNDELNLVKKISLIAPIGFDSNVFTYQNSIRYASNEGIFTLDLVATQLKKDTVLTSLFYENNDAIFGRLISEKTQGRLWGFSPYNIISLTQDSFDGIPERKEIAIPQFFRQNQGLTGYENISLTAQGDYIIGASNGFVVLDVKKFREHDYTIRINTIQKKFQNAENEYVSINEAGEFSFEENSFIVSFSVPTYDKYSAISYQYQLVGLYDGWSKWVNESNISLENLSYGDYTLKVRGRIGNILTSNVASYNFSVEKPWYWSNMAIILYVLFFALIMFVINRLFSRYYKNQRNRLIEDNKKKIELTQMESEQEIMKLRNDRLRNELESKNRELATTAMSLINKNELLLGIKHDLSQMGDKASRDEVIKVVNKNLNNNSDWEFFKEAFNNADKDFLNKMKNKHPELTANDLKFCAFLRLNLNSKEIAPLLNISVRSVEIKRYRLRKKMNLEHSINLIDYILEI